MIIEYKNFILVGTSHVAEDSVKEITSIIDSTDLSVVAIELDLGRLKNLLSEKKEKEMSSYKIIKEIGVFGFLFAKIASYMQNKVGNSLGVQPGVDMKTAYIKAREKKVPTALIDIPINITLKKLSKISFFEKIKLFFKLFTAGFKKKNRKELNFDVKKGVPNEKKIEKMLQIFKEEVPKLYDILIHQRNLFMVKKILNLRKEHSGKILVVVGAGHLRGMIEELDKEFKKIEENSSFSFSFIAKL